MDWVGGWVDWGGGGGWLDWGVGGWLDWVGGWLDWGGGWMIGLGGLMIGLAGWIGGADILNEWMKSRRESEKNFSTCISINETF